LRKFLLGTGEGARLAMLKKREMRRGVRDEEQKRRRG